MTTIKVILNDKGQLDSILADDEINIQVLKHGRDDNAIDEFEALLDVVDF